MLPGATDWGHDPDDALLYIGEGAITQTVPAARGDQRGFYVALREAMRGKGPNPVTAQQGAAVMAIIEAAILSHREGRRVAPAVAPQERTAFPA